MIAVALRFPAGRFHATPWGRHVNEGAPEWPPSPWRILRSLVAAWKLRAPHLPEDKVSAVLKQLSPPPRFLLPPATVGHTRHYMRWYKKGPEDQTLVFDAFVCLDRSSEVLAVWPEAGLSPEQHDVLAELVERLGYMGRAESWCEARLAEDEEADAVVPNCCPLCGEAPQQAQELVRVLCADPGTAFSDEHVKGTGAGRLEYDPCWHLCIETAQLHAEKWSDPPGSRWVTYVRRTDCFHPRPAGKRPSGPRRRTVQAARYLLDSAVLPPVSETLPLAEQTRARLMGIHGRMTGHGGVKGRSAVFSGKDADGRPLAGHGHAYYLPADEDGDGRLDHLTIVAEDGFDIDEVRALDRLRLLSRGEGLPPVNLMLVGLGGLGELQAPVLKQSREWVSATPFLVTRFPKKNGRKRDSEDVLNDWRAFAEVVLREELEHFCRRRRLIWTQDRISVQPLFDPPGVYRIQPRLWNAGAGGPSLRPILFERFRSRKSGDDGGQRTAGAFRITFPEAVRGPVSLGHSSHFGLGLFLPAQAGWRTEESD